RDFHVTGVQTCALPIFGHILDLPGVPPDPAPIGCFGRMAEQAAGKDTTTGHWELAGVILDRPFPVYPNGFPREVIDAFTAAIGQIGRASCRGGGERAAG